MFPVEVAERSKRTDLSKPSYKRNLEKIALVREIKEALRKEFVKMYRTAEDAYSALDFTGLGYISKESFLNSIIVEKRLKYSNE